MLYPIPFQQVYHPSLVSDSEDIGKKSKVKSTKKSKPVKDDKPFEMEWDIASTKKSDEDKTLKKKDSSNDAKDETDEDGQTSLF